MNDRSTSYMKNKTERKKNYVVDYYTESATHRNQSKTDELSDSSCNECVVLFTYVRHTVRTSHNLLFLSLSLYFVSNLKISTI